MTNPQSSFDEKARAWDQDAAKRERARCVAEAIVSSLPPLSAKRVLEYGAGTGLLGLALQPVVGEVTLADSSQEMLAVAREKIAERGIRNAEALYLDLTAGPAPDLQFDLVCTLMTLHHIPDTDQILGSFYRLLTGGGFLCIADLDQEDGSFHGAGFTGHKGFDRGDLAARLQRTGFSNVRFTTAFEVKKDTGTGARTFPVFLVIGEK